MALPITITDAGRAEIINAQNTGTGQVTIAEIGFGTGQYTPAKTRTALQAQVKRVSSIAGQAVAADTIHVMALDESSAAYNVGEFGLFSDKGTLIAVYSQPAASGWIIQKAGPSTLLLATDIILESLNATTITFGDISFLNPPATTTVQGVVELATPEETQAGADGMRAVTPVGLKSLTASTSRAGLVQLNDSLTSSSTTQALTAAQGKKLQDGKQPKDETLTALAALVTAANKLIFATGTDEFATADLTAFARSLLDDPNATAARETLGAAPLDSPIFTGDPKAPTPASTDNDTSIANTAFVRAAMALFGVGAKGGAYLATPSALLGADAATDWNTITSPGWWHKVLGTDNPNNPGGGTTYWYCLVLEYGGLGNCTQVAFPYGTGSGPGTLKWRTGYNGTWSAWQELWSTRNLVKQTGVDDLSTGRMVLAETVRRRLAGGVEGVYCDRLVLLHPLYVSAFLTYSIVDGKITATRGSTGASLNQASVEVVSSSAYNGHVTTFYSADDGWQAVSCTYLGVKYAALIVPYHASAYNGGIFFEGRAVSNDPNQLLCIEYYNRQTSAVINAEVHNSIAPLYVRKDFRICGDSVWHSGNLVKQSSPTDVTVGAMMPVGAFGLGATTVPALSNIDLDTIATGLYQVAASATGVPIAQAGLVVIERAGAQLVSQRYYSLASDRAFIRRKNGPTWGAWQELFHTGNVSTYVQTLLDDVDAATARATLGANNASNLNLGTVPLAQLPTAVRNQGQGDSTQDPNLAVHPVILSNHANTPQSSVFWHITTTFWSAIGTTSNRGQIAVSYNTSTTQVWARNCFNNVWTPWVRCDLGGVSVPKNTASLGVVGWWRDDDTGLIEQWGEATVAVDGTLAITFPITFPEAVFQGLACQGGAFSVQNDAGAGISAMTLSGGVLRNGSGNSTMIRWRVWGK